MPAWVVPAAIAAGGAIINAFQGWRARKVNENYVRQQNAYNSPKSQMARFQQAGLNPNLVYQQGNPGNQSTTLSQPEGLQRGGSDFVSGFNQSSVAQSQVAAQGAQKLRTEAMTEVAKLQAKVLQKNPHLSDGYVEALVKSMQETASQKASEAKIAGKQADWFTDKPWRETVDAQGNLIFDNTSNGWRKMDAELQLLFQRYDLGTGDLKLKAEVLQSKVFQNALQEIQLKWLKDSEITPQHIFQGIMLLLSKMF